MISVWVSVWSKPKMNLKIKTSNEATFGFDVTPETSVKELKQLISDHYKGKNGR